MAKMITAKNVDEYIQRFPEPQRSSLQKIREAIIAAAPKAEEGISYGMPGYKYNGALVYFGGFTNHCSFFPAAHLVIQQFREELKNYKTSKGTIQFPLNHPVPVALIKKMVKARMKENEMKLKIKANKKASAKKKNKTTS